MDRWVLGGSQDTYNNCEFLVPCACIEIYINHGPDGESQEEDVIQYVWRRYLRRLCIVHAEVIAGF